MKQIFIILAVAGVIIITIIGGGIYAANHFYGLTVADLIHDTPSADKKAERLEQNEIAVGDTGLDVIQAWGNPQDKNITDYGDSRNEQWIYYYPLGHSYRDKWNPYCVYVEYSSFNPNGKVTAIQY